MKMSVFWVVAPCTQRVSSANINRLTLFRKIAVYSENHTTPIDTLGGKIAELLNVKAGGAYSYDQYVLQ
jgi:hypothetical protein